MAPTASLFCFDKSVARLLLQGGRGRDLNLTSSLHSWQTLTTIWYQFNNIRRHRIKILDLHSVCVPGLRPNFSLKREEDKELTPEVILDALT